VNDRGDRALVVPATISLCALSAVLAVIGAFLSPSLPHVIGIPVPLGALVAIAGNVAVGLGGGLLVRSRFVPAATGFVWLAIALVLGSDGPGKDTVVAGTSRGFGFLISGVAAAAVSVGLLTSPRFDPDRRRVSVPSGPTLALHLPVEAADDLERGDPASDDRRDGG
jgi:hypothetical protein